METLNFLKFWKPNANIPSPVAEVENEVDDEEDSFFDLELNAPDFDSKENDSVGNNNAEKTEDTKGFGFNEEKTKSSDKTAGKRELFSPKPTISLSAADPISKRKILPLEPISKPQSPIALLRSAPKFRVLMFKKPKSTATKKTEKTGEAEAYSILTETQRKQKQEGKLSTVKFNVEEDSNISKLNRESSLRRIGSKLLQNQSSDDSTRTERKDILQKYLKLIKPLYAKASKRYGEKMKFQSDLSVASPWSSPVPAASMCSLKDKQGNIPAGIRDVCKHLGKSKSASAVSATVPTNRRDDSLLQQHDGIQSAILHYSSSLSRSTSDSSSMKSCFSDSSLLSHFISESSQDRSARSSIEDNYGVGI
ncbi:membrane-associated kinase regulator 5 isoform X2 [Ziziphus jujuba]|uniref:Membrane-associated kinase regulator 5 isoform X2 n=1 Tax=Ziziphus jujuba TaxID=326968 RepID=A0A6P3ZS94_ZIZJJ|nr:membrane-associated kinase regulator 5 isoform X2 [Ziziphus jujuba]